MLQHSVNQRWQLQITCLEVASGVTVCPNLQLERRRGHVVDQRVTDQPADIACCCCFVQDRTSGSVSGGDIIDPVQQEPQVILTSSGGANLQTNTQFLLYATYSVGGVPQAGIQISGWWFRRLFPFA